MAKVNADPEEMLEFVRALKQFNAQVVDLNRRLNARFMKLSETWQDDQQQKFSAEFAQTTKNLQNFVQFSESHIPILTKKAQYLLDSRNVR